MVEFLLRIDVSSYTSTVFAFLAALFMDSAKPVRESEYRSFSLDGWLPMVGWICFFALALSLFHPIVVFLSSIIGLGGFAGKGPVYSFGEQLILIIIILRAGLHQVFGKSLSRALEDFSSTFVTPDK